MSEFAGLLEGIALLAVGVFMVFFQVSAERMRERFLFVRTGGGALRKTFGWAIMLVGGARLAFWFLIGE